MSLPQRLVILLLAISCSIPSYAQKAHNTKPNSQCRFVKGPKNHEGMTPCDACFEQRKKDEAAVKAEYDKRMKANKAADAAKLQARLDDLKQKNAAEKKAREAQSKNVVSFALPESKPVKKEAPTKKLQSTEGGEVLYSTSHPEYLDGSGWTTIVTNAKDDTAFNVAGTEFASIWAANKKDPRDFPPGIAIVYLKYQRGQPKIYDLINAKGERVLNDNSISALTHIAGYYFFIGYNEEEDWLSMRQYARAGLYNVRDKSFTDFGSTSGRSGCVVSIHHNNGCDWEASKSVCKELTSDAAGYVITHSNWQMTGRSSHNIFIVTKSGKVIKRTLD